MKTETRMTLLSYLAYCDFYQPNCDKLAKNLTKMLLSVKEELTFSGIAWGPVAYKGDEVFSESLIYVVKDIAAGGEPAYTLVIRGTNPVSLVSWIFQDLNVAGQTPWSRQSTHTISNSSYISKATDTSLGIHKALTSGGKTVLDWLTLVIQENAGRKIKLNVCGHSLGGLMSTTFALWLHDELAYQELLDRVDLRVYAFAGPTAGNGAYAAYLKESLGDRYTCYVNDYDIAPCVWSEAGMERLPGIYGDEITMNGFEEKLYALLCLQVQNLDYTAPGNASGIPSTPNGKLGDGYILQAIYQHVFPYLKAAKSDADTICTLVLFEVVKNLVGRITGVSKRNGKARVLGALARNDFFEKSMTLFDE